MPPRLNPWHLFRYDNDEGAGGGGEGEQRPEWLPENFENPEALAASYAELQRTLSQRGEADRARETELQQLRQRAAKADEYEEYFQAEDERRRQVDPRERFMEVWEDPDRQADLVLTIVQQNQQLAEAVQRLEQGAGKPRPGDDVIVANYVDGRMAAEFDDWADLQPQVSEFVQNNPHLLGQSSNPDDILAGVKLAYKVVRSETLSTDEGRQAAETAAAEREARRQAQLTPSGSQRPATQSSDEEYWGRIRAADSGGYGS